MALGSMTPIQSRFTGRFDVQVRGGKLETSEDVQKTLELARKRWSIPQ